MGIKISDIPLSGLLSLQQVTEFGSREIHGFFQQVMKDKEEGLVSKSYFDELEISLEKKILNNNEASDLIEKEIFKRFKSVFGNKVSTPKIMPKLIEAYEKEKEKHKNLIGKKDNGKDVIPLDTGTSSEKKV